VQSSIFWRAGVLSPCQWRVRFSRVFYPTTHIGELHLSFKLKTGAFTPFAPLN
jgi:hypothetical protein